MDKNQNETKDMFLTLCYSLKFHCTMTCCVAINSKEGDCWYNWLIVCCPWCHTNVILVRSILFSAFQDHSVNEGKLDRSSVDWAMYMNEVLQYLPSLQCKPSLRLLEGDQ